jgi:hypothetical protein
MSLAYTAFPKEHWAQIASTNPLEPLNGEIKRRSNVVGVFPNDRAVVRLVGALMLEQNDEWAVSRRYMSLESLAPLSNTRSLDCQVWQPDQPRTETRIGDPTPRRGARSGAPVRVVSGIKRIRLRRKSAPAWRGVSDAGKWWLRRVPARRCIGCGSTAVLKRTERTAQGYCRFAAAMRSISPGRHSASILARRLGYLGWIGLPPAAV